MSGGGQGNGFGVQNTMSGTPAFSDPYGAMQGMGSGIRSSYGSGGYQDPSAMQSQFGNFSSMMQPGGTQSVAFPQGGGMGGMGSGYNFAQNAQPSMNSQFPNAYGQSQSSMGANGMGQPQGDPYMGQPMNFPTAPGYGQTGSVMDSGMPNFMPMLQNYQQQQQQVQQQPAGPPQSGPGSQQAYLQSLLQQDPSQQATQLTPQTPDAGKVATPANPLATTTGNFGGSPNTWLYGPTVGSLYPQLQKPQGTPNNFGYFPGNGTWGLPPGRS